MNVDVEFHALTEQTPLSWQKRLYNEHFALGLVPSAVDVPTGLGKTSVIALWLIARAHGAPLPRRLVYVVDRRAVVDQATQVAEDIAAKLGESAALTTALGLNGRTLPISTLRGAHVDNRKWLDDPAQPAIIVGTVDMIGSRLLFEGYGVSRKMRPYHAGLLGSDALVVLDESHLVPPFERLLSAVQDDEAFRSRISDNRKLIPQFVLLPLSATQRQDGIRARDDRKPFFLTNSDLDDPIVGQRLGARKILRVRELGDAKPEESLASEAWRLSEDGNKSIRCIVFCNSRDAAEKTKDALARLAKPNRRSEPPKAEVELLVGGRRIRERADAAQWLETRGFIAGKKVSRSKPTFLVATSAGEVGVDLDADCMVSDLAPWERMVQRLGRVNRRGEGNAEVIVLSKKPKPKKPEAPTEQEKTELVAYRSLDVIKRLPGLDGGHDASPGALRDLKARAADDPDLRAAMDASTTPAPLYPDLTRPLVDAWSMTSLEQHPGRPQVAPWLRGWIGDEAQTIVVWREHLPVRAGENEAPQTEVEEYFDTAEVHLSEELETETWRVADWLRKRAASLLKRISTDGRSMEGGGQSLINPAAPFAYSCSTEGITEFALAEFRDVKARGMERKINGLAGTLLVVDARLGGLDAGLLQPAFDAPARTADTDRDWSRDTGLRIRRAKSLEPIEGEWRFEHAFVCGEDESGADAEWLIVERLRGTEKSEEGRSIANPQSLSEHQRWTEDRARAIAEHVGLRGDHAEALAIAARLHDEGKRAARWQRAFNAPRGGEPFAKTRGPFNRHVLDHYRHEFGSLAFAAGDPAYRSLHERNPDLAELVLHLIASHHGNARPVIDTRGCDGPPSLLDERAREVALRFARLQREWGPWGLAWWEALLRAADAQASRANDERANHGAQN